MAEELPKIILSSSDRVMSRALGDEGTPTTDAWQVSGPIPGARIVNTWQIYNNIWLALTVTEGGHYCIYRTINLQSYTLVHDHSTRIFNIFYVDDGHVVFAAEDGWWATTDTGRTWSELSLGEAPHIKAAAVIPLDGSRWALVAYGQDHKIYYCEYPGGTWEETYDASSWNGKWYPALAGCAVGVLAGLGDQLIRSDRVGMLDSWYVLQKVNGIIKSIVISNQSTTPTFLIVVEGTNGEEIDKLYWTHDMGDSLVADLNRASPVAAVQSVTPTGSSEIQTVFVVLGKRTPDGSSDLQIITEE